MANERELIQACLRGERGAWDALVDAYGGVVYDAARYTLRRVLGAAHEADLENVVQIVFVNLCDREMARLRSFGGRSSFRTWITSVTARFALNYIRGEKRKGALRYCSLEASAEERLEDEGTSGAAPEEAERLQRAMEQLPNRDRLLLKLFYFDGASYQTIADLLKIPVNSVSPLLGRAKEALRRRVGTP